MIIVGYIDIQRVKVGRNDGEEGQGVVGGEVVGEEEVGVLHDIKDSMAGFNIKWAAGQAPKGPKP